MLPLPDKAKFNKPVGLAQTPNEHLPQSTSGAVRYGRFGAGFTLVETLVALTVLTVGLIPAFLQATTSLQLAGQVRNSLIAAHLAQEGVEVITAIRDTNWFSGNAFDAGLTDCAAGCTIEYSSTVPTALGGGPSPALRLDPATGLHQYAVGAATKFTRTITITQPTPNKMKVAAQVDWVDRTVNKSFVVELYLFNWLQ